MPYNDCLLKKRFYIATFTRHNHFNAHSEITKLNI